MPIRDLHGKPFDAGTRTKLSIYRSYVQGWLQVFLHTPKFKEQALHFFDLFCGPGADANGIAGSPLILLEELTKNRRLIEASRRPIRIVFNDADEEKIALLRELCSKRSFLWTPQFESLEFREAFDKFHKEFGAGPTLIFIDQNGVKHLTRAAFETLTRQPTTDFIFFIASSFKHRFGDLLAPEIPYPESTPHYEAHRVVADVYRGWAPPGMFIGHFSIKKEGNIYGLIFGSQHWRGMQKFLDVAWTLDSECGEANFEMEADTIQGEMDFDSGRTGFKRRKVEVFQEELLTAIQAGTLATDQAVFLHCLTNGFRPRVAKEVYAKFRENKVIKNVPAKWPRYSDMVMKEPRLFTI